MSADNQSREALVDWLLARGGETGSAEESEPAPRPPQAERLLKFCRLLEADAPTGQRPPDLTRPTVNGRYESLTLVGAGGGGTVYRAWDAVLKRDVALKFLRAGVAATPAARARFEREAQIPAGLRHPHIVTVFDYGTDAATGQTFLVMDWVGGGSLAARWGEFVGRPDKAAKLIVQVARAVQYAHDKGVVHRDLKPGNILLSDGGDASVADFGIAKLVQLVSDLFAPPEPAGAADDTLTDQLGTLPYMAPERFGAGATAGPAADVWAIGVVLYELLTGRRPFDARTHPEWAEAVRTRSPIRPRQLNRRIPRGLERICLKCLARNPQDRWASAGELADALGPRTRRRWRLVAVPVGALVAVLVAAAMWWAILPPSRDGQAATTHHTRPSRPGRLDLLTAGANGKALAVKRYGAEAIDLQQDDDGLRVGTSGYDGLIEFLSVVPAERYTVRLVVRTDPAADERPTFGLICRYNAFDAPFGGQHYVHGLFVSNDPLQNAASVFFEQRWIGQWPRPGNKPPPKFRPILPAARLADYHRVIGGQFESEEWELAVRVTPAEATGSCSRAGSALWTFGPLTAKDRTAFLHGTLADFPRPLPFPQDEMPGSGVGLFLGSGTVTVLRFEVELDP